MGADLPQHRLGHGDGVGVQAVRFLAEIAEQGRDHLILKSRAKQFFASQLADSRAIEWRFPADLEGKADRPADAQLVRTGGVAGSDAETDRA